MANVKISALTTLTSMTDATVVPVVESSTTKKITAANVKVYVQTNPVVSGPLKLATYVNGTARDAAITSPERGMLVFNLSTDKVEVWTGAQWSVLGP
jgi:hypothetical protein